LKLVSIKAVQSSYLTLPYLQKAGPEKDLCFLCKFWSSKIYLSVLLSSFVGISKVGLEEEGSEWFNLYKLTPPSPLEQEASPVGAWGN
jgi:hypothetical protein